MFRKPGGGGGPRSRFRTRPGLKPGTSYRIMRCFNISQRTPAPHPSHPAIEGIMATRQNRQIVETPTEARQGEPGPSVLALLTVSTGLAMLILGLVRFVFFRSSPIPFSPDEPPPPSP